MAEITIYYGDNHPISPPYFQHLMKTIFQAITGYFIDNSNVKFKA
ncbi:hypothetical protein SARI_04373 [Salmonella enterica subsp. arizonae serovar 62:z4,z23:-]|uniref:Uncharacterized protein n=1 Tax=Salmonella arizonae (strain ATCC BAA-731 / CDC346-86 / RSK2980) TaxID=41514 RepID=A9MPQ8_SALAR|nr:hypothetical protein SARI_04373 [Salmonella enterica subsp. arizonae serovar 62:z4,z23:-]